MANFHVFFIRHAEESKKSKKGVVGDTERETVLSRKGHRQVQALKQCLMKIGEPDAVYASPAARAKETAERATTSFGIANINVSKQLRELDQALWHERLQKSTPTEKARENISGLGKDFKHKGDESINEAGARMLGWLHSEASNWQNNKGNYDRPYRVYVFTHSLAIRSMLSVLQGWSYEQTIKTHIKNASITLLEQDDNDWYVAYFDKSPTRCKLSTLFSKK